MKEHSTITAALLSKYLAGKCTAAEERLIAEWYAAYDHQPSWFDEEDGTEATELKEKTKQVIRSAIAVHDQTREYPVTAKKVYKGFFTNTRIAAAVLILLTAGIVWKLVSSHQAKKVFVQTQPKSVEITPGSNKAILTLADGSSVVLDNAANGTLAQQGHVQVVKSKDGELKYLQATDNAQSTSVQYNKLCTPRGGQYTITLPDGSKVWLNAASSIKYPTAFTGNERKVEVTGEVYFEVATCRLRSGQKMPFIVSILSGNGAHQEQRGHIEVLGTHFNVNAYSDEASINTTLLEGKVKVASGERPVSSAKEVILKPGEQAMLTTHLPITINHSPHLDEVMAWKNGLFHFDDVTIQTVMRQIARWYDVDVVYERDVLQDRFRGKIYRSENISQVLKILELSGVHFKIEGKKVIVQ